MSKILNSILAITLMSGVAITGYAKNTTSPTLDKTNLEESSQSSLVEIANLQVFKEVCPELIGENKNLNQGIHKILGAYLPGFKDPELALSALNQEDYYQPILQQARQEVANASKEDNRQVCLSIVNWDKKKK
ncbi:hypothetical protein F4V57_01450 [Acinetobacter qingfengensis]|uniref:DUF7944 domain-containing protein n=1 Tax=Acinetobacter qingfengensis TaxID=1262585 RepID=A0A1E7R9E9_9GAMM|nr:hypothetical protein [Acinetobacter qingfengensis]KAA8735491.1 hypothetical protein F4V57_01450 [Acinetobacter qingfengensis]OEY95863.1 hypothetical protein BJI46_02795 [Acinetobacter qingfengensis]